ncbi:MAG: YIP1 family protein [Caldisericaceae bacterium]
MTIELILKMLARPGEAFKKIKEQKPMYATILYLLLFGVVLYLFTYASFLSLSKENLSDLPQELQSVYASLGSFISFYVRSEFMLVFSLLSPFVSTFVTVAFYNLFAELAVRKSDGLTLFISWTFASSPVLLQRLISLIYSLVFRASMPAVVSLVFILWEIYLFVIAIKNTYEIKTSIAWLIFSLPIIAAMLGFLYIVYFVSSFNLVAILIRGLI